MKKTMGKPKIKKETDTEMLARLMLTGFEEIKNTMATKQDLAEVKQDLAEVKQDLAEVKQEVASVKEEQKDTNRVVKSIEKKQMGTLLSLDESVHRSEFDGLVRRVEVLEK